MLFFKSICLLLHVLWPRRWLVRYQQRRLRRLLRYAYTNSPYYRRAFQQAGIRQEQLDTLPLNAFPVLTKEKLIASFDDVVTVPGITQQLLRTQPDSPKLKGCRVIHSSGSTAEPTFFLYDKAAWDWVQAGLVRLALLCINPIRSLRVFLVNARILYAAVTGGGFAGATLADSIGKNVGAAAQMLDVNEPLEHWRQVLRQFRPNILAGYPSSMKLMAMMNEKDGEAWNLRFVLTSGEPLSTSLREYLEKRLQCPIANLYACSESLILGLERGREDFMLFDDMNLIEVEDGQVYLTNLCNFAQPLIRYCISDQLELLPAQGRLPFSRAKVFGVRNEDILWFHKGERMDFLHPLLFEDFCIPGLLEYQLVQTGEDAFALRFVAKEGAEEISRLLEQSVSEILEQHGLDFVQCSIEQTEVLLPDPKTGKRRLAIPLPGRHMALC